MFIINYFVDPANSPAPLVKRKPFGLWIEPTGPRSFTTPEPGLRYLSESQVSGISSRVETLFFMVMLAATLTAVSSALPELLRFLQS